MHTITEKDQQSMQRLVAILEDWADWMRRGEYVEGYPDHSPVVSGAGLKSFDDMCEMVDGATNEAVDAVIHDLPPSQQAAINRRYLNAVYRFPRPNYTYAQALMDAHEALMIALPRKGVVVGF